MAIGLASGSGAAAGTLAFHANGEALATDGFVGETRTGDGWALRFDHVHVTLAGIAAHQTEPPFEAGSGTAPEASVSVPLEGDFTVDLVAVREDGRVLVGETAAPAGRYNALTWSMAPATEGALAGHALVLIGTAEKDGREVAFTLRSVERQSHACGEFVGDTRKGVVAEGGAGDVEMTLHLDHLFGRADLPADDPMNVAAIGFEPFASGGVHDFELGDLHVGHVGEGACDIVAD